MKKVLIGAAAVAAVLVLAGAWWFTTSINGTQIEEDVLVEETEAPEVITGPVAVVNGAEISGADYSATRAQLLAEQGIDPSVLDEQANAALQTQIIDMLISRTLVQQAASNSKQTVEETAVDAQMEMIISQFQNDAEFEAALNEQAMTRDELRSQVRTDLIAEAYLAEELDLLSITASEEEVQTAYDQVAAGEEVPPLEEVKAQVEALVVQQKQQEKISEHIAQLRETATVEILL